MEKKITIDDVARALGVSKTTVSRAISGKGRISAQTRKRVMEYIEENGYKPSIIAKGLAKSKTYNLGLVMPGYFTFEQVPYFQQTMAGICEQAGKMDYDVLIIMTDGKDSERVKRVYAEGKVDGFMVMPPYIKDPVIEFLTAGKVPFVSIGTATGYEVTQVGHNAGQACCELTEHILQMGLDKICLLGKDEEQVVYQLRLEGYLSAYRKLGIPMEKAKVFPGADSVSDVERIMNEVLKEKYECVLCMDDWVCDQVLHKLRKEQVRVPDDIMIASFHNSTLLENHSPGITCLEFDSKGLGMLGCKLLVDKINGTDAGEQILEGYEIKIKESTRRV